MRLEIFLQQSSLDCYVFASEKNPGCLITSPGLVAEPDVYANWLSNNNLIIGIIHAAISDAEQEGLKTNRTAKQCYDALKARAHHESLIKQVAFICKAFFTYAPFTKPTDMTAWKICKLIDCTFAIEP